VIWSIISRIDYWKIFRTKVAWLERRHMMKMWTWLWVILSKPDQGH